ncbi:MAG: hypothetical protein RL264_865 [Bacteroidota bacterium]|jgi:putative lipoic acid-binding regulatory protein
MSRFENLKAQLEQQDWPGVYWFKFIIANDNQKMAQLSALFDEHTELQFHNSSNGKYVSVSAKLVMMDAESVIEIYRQAAEIEGIISL